MSNAHPMGISGRIAALFLHAQITPLLALVAFLLGEPLFLCCCIFWMISVFRTIAEQESLTNDAVIAAWKGKWQGRWVLFPEFEQVVG